MKKITLTSCKICGEQKTPRGFGQHVQKSHNINLKDYIVKYECNGIEPTCKCGCGQPVTIRGYEIMDYVDYHSPSGRFENDKTPNRDYDKWKTNVTKGIQNYNKKIKKENPEYRSGENNNFYGKKHKEITKNIIKEKVEDQIASGKHAFIGNLNGRLGKSSLEKKFEEFLIENNIFYIHNYKIDYYPENKNVKRYKYYDFYIPFMNKLIELHGSYWHPKELNENLSDLQINNYHNDIFKIKLAKENGYELEIVYDKDLENYMKNMLYVVKDKLEVEVQNQ